MTSRWVLGARPRTLPAAVVPVLVATFRRFRFSNFSYGLITIFLTLHAFGAHYTCSEMPVGNSADVLRRQFEEG